jgi:hypothetical protein
VGSGVGSADADVVQVAGQAQGDAAGGVDLVGADSVVGVEVGAGGGFGAGGVGGRRGGSVGQRAVRAVVVVGVDEGVEQDLQGGEGGWLCLGWAWSQFFIVCWKRSTLPQVVGWLGREFFWVIPRRASSVSRPVRPPRPPAKRVV